jgi:hypothetical protein
MSKPDYCCCYYHHPLIISSSGACAAGGSAYLIQRGVGVNFPSFSYVKHGVDERCNLRRGRALVATSATPRARAVLLMVHFFVKNVCETLPLAFSVPVHDLAHGWTSRLPHDAKEKKKKKKKKKKKRGGN